jgi:hypothetical protein
MSTKVPSRKVIIAAGQTWTDSAVWCTTPWVYKVISAVTRGWPTVITAASHGIMQGVQIPVWIANALGTKSINTSQEDPWIVEYSDTNTLTLLGVNTGGQTAYVANSATMSYMPPKDLTGFTARAQFRLSVDDPILIECVSTGLAPEFALIEVLGNIVLTLTPEQTRALLDGGSSQTTGIAHVELIDTNGVVFRPWDYAWTCTPEGTREA